MNFVTNVLQQHGAALFGAAAVVLLLYIGRLLHRLYTLRSACHYLPGPPHSWLFGHLGAIAGVASKLPTQIAPQALLYALKQEYNLGPVFAFDSWPFGPPMLVSCDPDVSNQFVIQRSMPKSSMLAEFSAPLAGRENMVADDGQRWRRWRSAFNSGFAASYLMGLVPEIVDKVTVFRNLLASHATNNDLFRLEKLATRVTIDIIGKVVLDTEFNSQTRHDELVDAFESQVRWLAIGGTTNPMELIDFRRPFVQWWNARRMNRYLTEKLETRFATRKDRMKSRHVIDLALEAYFKESGKDFDHVQTLEKDFKQAAIDQIKLFIFAGHDTSSSIICYCFYHLAKNPAALAEVRKELDIVFGTDIAETAELIKQDGRLINKLEYVNAVIREVLRLHPPASTIRQGSSDFFLVDPDTNEKYPTEHFDLLSLNLGLHFNKRRWNEPEKFIPERWLTNEPAPEGADRDSWVPFSKGPRNCIGQELALMELRIVLAMTMRSFDFHAAFNEVEKLKGDGSGYPSSLSGIQQVFGMSDATEAYQTQMGTAKPREGMPCRLTMAA